MQKIINIIGGGLAGSEAAYQLAKRGFKVNLYEIKRIKRNPVQVTDNLAELVCSNSLRSNQLENAVGTLKQEMRMLDSLIIKAADATQIPAGGALAVDREAFSFFITSELKNNNNITIFDEEVTKIDITKPTIIASGPLTSDKLQLEIQNIIGNDDLHFFDAVAPIVSKDSLDMNILFRKNRYEKGDTKDYLNAPMNKEQYEIFYNELINAEVSQTHLEGERDDKFFEGCMPIEVMAKRGIQTLLYGPLKPAGLKSLDGTKNYAVVQLRQDNAVDSLYNLVGFQTNLKWKEQERVFKLIPGLENAKFVRYGVMHKNNYINTPKVLNEFLQLKSNQNIFFAGQITGVEGYVESAMSGLLCGINLSRFLMKKTMILPDNKTVSGGLLNYIHKSSPEYFDPMKANWNIVEKLPDNTKIKKLEKKKFYSSRALDFMGLFVSQIND